MSAAVCVDEATESAGAGGRRRGSRHHPTTSHPHSGSKIGYWWTHELVRYALNRFHQQHLRTPTQQEIRAGTHELPSYATTKRLYGNFGAMLRYHGYSVRARGGQRGRSRNAPPTPVRKAGDPLFGQALRRLREAQRLSQVRLGRLSQLHPNYIGGVERGEINPTLKTIRSLALGLGLRPSQLLAASEARAGSVQTAAINASRDRGDESLRGRNRSETRAAPPQKARSARLRR
jgi:transcriptional regulator with XRE-family HTH domain